MYRRGNDCKRDQSGTFGVQSIGVLGSMKYTITLYYGIVVTGYDRTVTMTVYFV